MSGTLVHSRSRMARSLAVVAFAITMISPLAPARAAELWQLDTGGDIIFQRLTPLGTLLVSTEMNLRAVDPETGKTLWMRDDVRKLKECNYDEITDTPFGLLDLNEGVRAAQRRIEVIDLENGRKKWDSKDLPMSSSQGLFPVPHKNMLLMVGAARKGNRSVLIGVDLQTGQMKWRQDALFTRPLQLFEARGSSSVSKRYSVEGNQRPIFDSENTAVLYLSGEGPMKIDLSTGNKLWVAEKLKGMKPPAPRNGYAPMLVGEGVVFVPYGKSLQALDAQTGAPLWKQDRAFKSPIAQMQAVSQGLIVRGAPQMDDTGKITGKPFIDLLDPKTGLSVWKKPFKDLENATTFDVRDNQLTIAADGELFTIQLADGASQSVAKYKFKGNEVPTTLEVVDGNYLLSSSQNMMMLASTGEQKYHCYYAAPGAGGGGRVATTAAITAANAASAASAESRVMTTGETQHYTLITANPTLSKRLKASAGAEGYSSMVASVEANGRKGPGLVKIEKASGQEKARVILGDKTPDYEMDPIAGRVFFMKSAKEIVCYSF